MDNSTDDAPYIKMIEPVRPEMPLLGTHALKASLQLPRTVAISYKSRPHSPSEAIINEAVTKGARFQTAMVRSMSKVDADPAAVLIVSLPNVNCISCIQIEAGLHIDNRQSTYERLTVDLGRHICDKIETDEPEPKRVLAVKVEE